VLRACGELNCGGAGRRRTVSKEEDGDVEVQSRLTLEEIQAGFPGGEEENDFDMEMGHTDGSDAHPPLLDTAACTPPTPFASSAVQVRAKHSMD
jgi:hypothetical protein